MQEIIGCPSCGRKLQVPVALLGQDVQCPTCGATFVATSPSGAAPPARELPPPRTEPPRYEGGYDARGDPHRQPPRDVLPHRAGAILTLGILSLVATVVTLGLLAVVLGPIAWVMGQNDLQEMRTGRMDREGLGNTNSGRVCGMIGTLVGGVVLLAFCMLFVIGLMEESRRGW